MMGTLWFVTGGARSGKSRFAEQQASAEHEHGRPVVYIATMEPGDEELKERVTRHRTERPTIWHTVEAPLDLTTALRDAPANACVLIDCISLWVANILLTEIGKPDPKATQATPMIAAELERRVTTSIDEIIISTASREGPTIAVSNEVGSGVVPPNVLGRIYRDLLGIANQRLSTAAKRTWLIVAGRALELPPPHEQ